MGITGASGRTRPEGSVPKEFQTGTATLDQIKLWMAGEILGAPGESRWVLDEPDLDLDDAQDLPYR